MWSHHQSHSNHVEHWCAVKFTDLKPTWGLDIRSTRISRCLHRSSAHWDLSRFFPLESNLSQKCIPEICPLKLNFVTKETLKFQTWNLKIETWDSNMAQSIQGQAMPGKWHASADQTQALTPAVTHTIFNWPKTSQLWVSRQHELRLQLSNVNQKFRNEFQFVGSWPQPVPDSFRIHSCKRTRENRLRSAETSFNKKQSSRPHCYNALLCLHWGDCQITGLLVTKFEFKVLNFCKWKLKSLKFGCAQTNWHGSVYVTLSWLRTWRWKTFTSSDCPSECQLKVNRRHPFLSRVADIGHYGPNALNKQTWTRLIDWSAENQTTKAMQ